MAVGFTARIRCREETREHRRFKAAVEKITAVCTADAAIGSAAVKETRVSGTPVSA
jgi:hypothetical protein